jgi:hypothetical protein
MGVKLKRFLCTRIASRPGNHVADHGELGIAATVTDGLVQQVP